MKNVSFFSSALFISMVAFFAACTSPQKLYEQGNHDEAISLAVEKLRKREVKEKHITTLVEAFNYINQQDAQKLTRLRAERSPETWSTIYDLSTRISRRQELVKPLLAMDDDRFGGKLSALYFENGVNFMISEAKDGAAAYLYEKAKANLELARTGQRLSARSAYNNFNDINPYFSDYKDAKSLMSEAYSLGLNHVYFTVENQSRAYLPLDFERSLQSVFVRDLNSQWIKYHTTKDENLRYEYNIVAKMTNIDVSPERFDRNHHVEEAKIEDGFDYVLDGKGNVKKDSLGNDIKTKRFKTVYADVFEVQQMKEARVNGYLEYFDNRTKERVVSQPIKSLASFSHYSVRFEGDRRALCEKTCRLLSNRPAPFPSDAELLLTAAENLKGNAKRIVRENDYVVSK